MLHEIQLKLEHYCAYQDRCHKEVTHKLYQLGANQEERDTIIIHLITQNFLNEERFARSFARGKHRIKHWGKIRITNELKIRNINQTLINLALKEIEPEEYIATFEELADRNWISISENDLLKKRKKFCDYMLRRGFESNLIYDKVKELENGFEL